MDEKTRREINQRVTEEFTKAVECLVDRLQDVIELAKQHGYYLVLNCEVYPQAFPFDGMGPERTQTEYPEAESKGDVEFARFMQQIGWSEPNE